MTDREDAIKWLNDLAYREREYLSMIEDGVESPAVIAAKLETIAEMLKEQEPVKPKPTGIEPNYNCGACKMPITQGYPFCPWCGRKVLWDD